MLQMHGNYMLKKSQTSQGLPEGLKLAAKQRATEKKSDDTRWMFTLDAPSYIPALTYLENRALRESIWSASSDVGALEPHDNTELIKQIIRLRDEKAKLLGKEHFADFTTSRRMAKSGSAALEFIQGMHEKVLAPFKEEVDALKSFAREELGDSSFELEPWDVAYWSERQRKALYDFDEEDLRPYFPITSVIDGMFELAQKVFGVKIEPIPH